MDTEYADAVNRLEDEINSACVRAESALSAKEIAEELRRIAKEIEDEARVMPEVKTEELRKKVADAIREGVCFHPDLATDNDWLEAADHVLAVPEIRDGLAMQGLP